MNLKLPIFPAHTYTHIYAFVLNNNYRSVYYVIKEMVVLNAKFVCTL